MLVVVTNGIGTSDSVEIDIPVDSNSLSLNLVDDDLFRGVGVVSFARVRLM